MNDEQRYRRIVNAATRKQNHFFTMLKDDDCSNEVKHLLWLRLMGLAETWVLI